MIEVAVDRAAPYQRFGEVQAYGIRNVLEFLSAEVAKQQRWLLVFDLGLYAPDLFLYMSVRGEDVGVAVQLVIEEKHPKTQRQQAIATHAGPGSFIHEQGVAFVVIEPQHLMRKVAHQEARAAGAIVIGPVDPQGGARHTSF